MSRQCRDYWELWEAWSTAEQDKAAPLGQADRALTALQLHAESCVVCAEDWKREKLLIDQGKVAACTV